jgi:predicted acylesterase/phospholipase RssA
LGQLTRLNRFDLKYLHDYLRSEYRGREAIDLDTPAQSREVEREPEGTGLCLSGGGYRAMLFHAGSLLHLFETGVLATKSRVFPGVRSLPPRLPLLGAR